MADNSKQSQLKLRLLEEGQNVHDYLPHQIAIHRDEQVFHHKKLVSIANDFNKIHLKLHQIKKGDFECQENGFKN